MTCTQCDRQTPEGIDFCDDCLADHFAAMASSYDVYVEDEWANL